ncbi:MAG TPA: ABC transporter substrate-binding protein [Xanthobacteraceae bacterium]|nr:ABC transporter substrate-binding protein [Xanthobacteraceae bacterium]
MKHHLSRREFGRAAVATGAVLAGGILRRARAESAPLKLGVLAPRSGFEALIGQGCQRGFEIAVPVLRDMGYAIELMSADTESKPEVARTQAEKLIREGAQVLCGAWDSGQTAALAQVSEQHGVPLVINIAADPKITEQGYKFVFRNFPNAPMLMTGALSLVKDLFDATGTTPKTAVLMAVNDTFGQAAQRAIDALIPKLGMPFRLVETITYDPQARDLSVEVAKAKAAGADLHLGVTRLNDGILMVREMVKQRYEPMGIISPGSPGFYERPLIKALGKYAEYCFSNNTWMDPNQPLTKTVEAAFAKTFPDDPFDLNVGFSFEAALIAADAYKRAGSSSPAALVEALRATSIAQRVMIGGPIRFDEKGQNVDNRLASLQIRDGRPTVVLPAANAEAKPVFPMPGWSQRT